MAKLAQVVITISIPDNVFDGMDDLAQELAVESARKSLLEISGGERRVGVQCSPIPGYIEIEKQTFFD